MSAKRQEIEEAIKKLAQALASPEVEVTSVRTNLGRYRIPVGPMRDALSRSIHRVATGNARIRRLGGRSDGRER
jgi:hypothetical protein